MTLTFRNDRWQKFTTNRQCILPRRRPLLPRKSIPGPLKISKSTLSSYNKTKCLTRSSRTVSPVFPLAGRVRTTSSLLGSYLPLPRGILNQLAHTSLLRLVGLVYTLIQLIALANTDRRSATSVRSRRMIAFKHKKKQRRRKMEMRPRSVNLKIQ